MFDIPSQGTDVKSEKTLEDHKVGVTDLAPSVDKMVSADEDGNIIIWQCEGSFKKIRNIRGTG